MRLRRKSPVDDDTAVDNRDDNPDDNLDDSPDVSTDEGAGAGTRPGAGPWDAADHPATEGDDTRVDLGALSVRGREGLEVRLQVDEASQQVASVMLVAADGALELRAFAAARHEDLWATIRPQISSEAARHGGTATEVEGPFGTGLELRVPAVDPEGRSGTQQSLVVGIPGPRWLLRVTMFGRPAVDYQPDGLLEQALRDVVVDRGSEAMPPGEALVLSLPSGAQRVDGPA